jgi:uncharacterized delta-60 repeat protein
MKIRTALLLIPVLLALCVGTAVAKAPPAKPGVDPSFGHGGTIAVSVPKGSLEGRIQMATAPSGKSYVLVGSLVLGFGANGRPDTGFGHNGRVQVAAAAGETTEVTGLAVDADGRILVSGSFNPSPGTVLRVGPYQPIAVISREPSDAFVARYLPNGERDPTFGAAGEVDVTVTPPTRLTTEGSDAHLETPAVYGDRLAIVNGEQPVLGGSYAYYADTCYGGIVPAYGFVAAVAAGSGSQNLTSTAYTQVPQSSVSALAPMPGGNLAALSDPSKGCGLRGEPWSTTLSSLTYGNPPAPALDPSRPQVSLSSLAVDANGRFLGLEGPEGFPFDGTAPPWKLVRLLPSGDFDTGFGPKGAVYLTKFGEEAVGGVVVGANERPVVAGGDARFRLVRVGTKGKIDRGFGKSGWLEVGFGKGSKASPQALTIDAKGRVLAAGPVTSPSLKTGGGVALTRILPGS